MANLNNHGPHADALPQSPAGGSPMSQFGTDEIGLLLNDNAMEGLAAGKLATLVQSARQMMGSDAAMLALADQHQLHFPVFSGSQALCASIDAGFGKAVASVAEGGSLQDQTAHGACRAAVPLRLRGINDGLLRPVGFLAVIFEGARSPDEADQAMLGRLAAIAEALLEARINVARTRLLASARQRTVDDLVRMIRQFRQAERIANMGSWRLTLADQKIIWSAQTYVIHGLDSGREVTTRIMEDCYPVEDLNMLTAAIARTVKTGEPFAVETDFFTMTGERRRVQNIGELETLNGEAVALVAVIQDVTARYQLECDLKAAREQAEAADEAKSLFLANVSHEIRTPMNGLVGFIDLLRRSTLDDVQRRYVDLLADSSDAMMRLISDLLDISRIESGPTELVREPVVLAEQLARWVGLMEAGARAKNLRLLLRIEENVPAVILGDSQRLRQVLQNLLGNAIKFTEQGSVELRVSRDAPGGATIRFDVIDTGIGVPADKSDVIFRKFMQADASISARFGGTGLGLAISSELVKRMGGSISVRSGAGEGSTFTVRLPLIEASATPDAPDLTSAMLRDPPREDGGTRRLLIAEDNPINQELTLAMARLAGLQPEVAGDGLEALEKVKAAAASGRPFDLVLMDIRMPNMNGLEATRALRAHGFGPDRLPIVALTANAFEDDRETCLAAGMQDHLAKPLRTDDLFAMFDRVFGAHAFPVAVAADVPPVGSGLAARYARRRDETIAMLADIVDQGLFPPERFEHVLNMLHKLAGTAGSFDDDKVGAIALGLEKSLARSPENGRLALVEAGWAELVAAMNERNGQAADPA